MITETKIVELVIVADHAEVSTTSAPNNPTAPLRPSSLSPASVPILQVMRYPDFQQLLNRTLEVVWLLDTVSAGWAVVPADSPALPLL